MPGAGPLEGHRGQQLGDVEGLLVAGEQLVEILHRVLVDREERVDLVTHRSVGVDHLVVGVDGLVVVHQLLEQRALEDLRLRCQH